MMNFFKFFAVLIFSISSSVSANWATFIVAKGYTANQSSVYEAIDNPNFGIDGNRNGTYITGAQCIHTVQPEALSWWMVDLEADYLISGALVWNRLDKGWESRFTQVSVGVTSNAAVWTTFDVAKFSLCMYYSNVPTISDNPINFTCSSPITGRYLTVYKNPAGLATNQRGFHFCEVDVIAVNQTDSDLSRQFLAPHVQPSFSSASTSLLFNSSFYARSDIECSIVCSNYQTCSFVLHKSSSFQCWLFSSFNISSSFSSIYSSGDASFLAVVKVN